MKRLFVTATDTEVGKTVASCALIHGLTARGRRVAGLKPVASGSERIDGRLRNADALALQRAANIDLSYREVNPYAFEPPIAPHYAARETATAIDIDTIRTLAAAIETKHSPDYLVVEGVGGWQVPLSDGEGGDDSRAHRGGLMLSDLVAALECRVILVVAIRLGCLNHALLSAERIRADGFELLGWIANRVDPQAARQEEQIQSLTRRIEAPRLGVLPWQSCPDPVVLAGELQIDHIDR